MAQKQDPPKRRNTLKKIDKVIKRTVKPKAASRIIKKALAQGDRSSAAESYRSMARGAVSAMLPKTNALKNALAKGDQSSASSSFTARAAKKVAMGAGKALKSIAAKKDSTSNSISSRINSIVGGKKKVAPSVKIDSTKKVMPGGGSKPSVIIKKQTTVKPAKPGVISGPYRPNPESKNKPQVKTLPYKPITKEFRKKMQAWDKLPKVEYKPLPKK